MKTTLVMAVAGISLLSWAPVIAHHSVAGEFDPSKPVTVTGTVTKIEWVNPHSRVRFDVTDASGTVTNWSVELAARVVLERNGWNGRSLKAGDKITVTGDQARSGAPMMNARGRELASLRNGGPKEYPIVRGDGTPVLYER
ncbi:MAG: hypothetical protein EXQ48_05920 [Acidobacteria bacterium]|nr:hypothetical protein [Acidobacteriota bacterium]